MLKSAQLSSRIHNIKHLFLQSHVLMCPTFTSDGLLISENPHGTGRALLRHTALHKRAENPSTLHGTVADIRFSIKSLTCQLYAQMQCCRTSRKCNRTLNSYFLSRYSLTLLDLSLIHISEPTRQAEISYAVFCLKKKKQNTKKRIQTRNTTRG